MNLPAMDLPATVYAYIKYSIVIGVTYGAFLLLAGSVLVNDSGYITRHPRFFLSETLVMGLLSSIPILYISYLRQGPLITTAVEFLVFFFKIAMIHVGFQLSGVYSVLFPKSVNM
jgi:hypothetical protein